MKQVLVYFGIIFFFIASLQAQESETTYTGNPAPDFSLNDLNGNVVDMASYQGQYLVIHIATTWCPFCNAEAPYLEKLANEYRDKNVKVLIIDVKEPQSLVKEKLQDRFNFSFPVLLDEDGTVAASFAPEGVLPDLARDEVMLASNLLIDPEGNIQFLSLLDSKNFDAKLVSLRSKLDELLSKH
ncbi:peroxiredoxin family protein [Mangrovimonas aestuarii]|uniref:peroxiredoxin family protein n=1 Tax=Mangrovimonas aestuarii TaxID=3018443 RepID=UPI0023797816|nr:peroxiredoxin family protein [Mangrovimonas aestuarii]